MNDFFIFLVLAGIALIFRWLGNRTSTEATSPTPPSPSRLPKNVGPGEAAPRAPAQSDEEKVRRFLEALGMPSGTTPPPPVRPRTAAPRPVLRPTRPQLPEVKRSWAQPLPPLVNIPPDEPPLPPLPSVPEPLPPPLLAPTPLPPVLTVPDVRRTPRAPAQSQTWSLGEMLRTPGSARQAIILREILGPPRSLQPFETATSLV